MSDSFSHVTTKSLMLKGGSSGSKLFANVINGLQIHCKQAIVNWERHWACINVILLHLNWSKWPLGNYDIALGVILPYVYKSTYRTYVNFVTWHCDWPPCSCTLWAKLQSFHRILCLVWVLIKLLVVSWKKITEMFFAPHRLWILSFWSKLFWTKEHWQLILN